MNAGLPGTGIAGLFYLICTFIMLFYECFLLVRGKSNKKRWKVIIPQLSIALIMILVAYGVNLIFVQFIRMYTNSLGLSQTNITYINPLFIPFFILISVLLLVHIAHLLVNFNPTRKQ